MSMWSRKSKHDFTDLNNKLWLVPWQLDGDEDETLKPFEFLKDVEAFHHYCAANGDIIPCIRTHQPSTAPK